MAVYEVRLVAVVEGESLDEVSDAFEQYCHSGSVDVEVICIEGDGEDGEIRVRL